MANQTNNDQQASCERQFHLSAKDLPLSCPLPNQRIWDAHPKVYLPIEATGQIVCPYCGVKYILKDET